MKTKPRRQIDEIMCACCILYLIEVSRKLGGDWDNKLTWIERIGQGSYWIVGIQRSDWLSGWKCEVTHSTYLKSITELNLKVAFQHSQGWLKFYQTQIPQFSCANSICSMLRSAAIIGCFIHQHFHSKHKTLKERHLHYLNHHQLVLLVLLLLQSPCTYWIHKHTTVEYRNKEE